MAQYAGSTRDPAEYAAHLERIRVIMSRWMNGEIGVAAKREQIAAENAVFYADDVRGETGALITRAPKMADEVALSLADRLLVPDEAASAAVDALRRAGWHAANSDDLEDERAVLEAGREAYREILRASR